MTTLEERIAYAQSCLNDAETAIHQQELVVTLLLKANMQTFYFEKALAEFRQTRRILLIRLRKLEAELHD